MTARDRYELKTQAAENLVKEDEIDTLPVDPFKIARDREIEVRPMPPSTRGVSGMLIRHGNNFGIGYATYIGNQGFQRFSVAHELGHYFLPGHPEHVVPEDDIPHKSNAGFASGNRYELEADHFAVGLLMPRSLFRKAIDREQSEGLTAILNLADLCVTSLTTTAIQYAKCATAPMAIVVSTDRHIDYCFMSDPLKEIRGLEWLKKGSPLPRDSATFRFNANPTNVASAATDEDSTTLQDWFGGKWDAELGEEVIGLGSYGKTLTVLCATESLEQEELDEEEDLEESWTPRFR